MINFVLTPSITPDSFRSDQFSPLWWTKNEALTTEAYASFFLVYGIMYGHTQILKKHTMQEGGT